MNTLSQRETADASPALWNPNAAALWSLLISPIFGAYLQMRNWQALGCFERAEGARRWILFGIVFLLLAVVLAAVLPETDGINAVSRMASLSWLIA